MDARGPWRIIGEFSSSSASAPVTQNVSNLLGTSVLHAAGMERTSRLASMLAAGALLLSLALAGPALAGPHHGGGAGRGPGGGGFGGGGWHGGGGGGWHGGGGGGWHGGGGGGWHGGGPGWHGGPRWSGSWHGGGWHGGGWYARRYWGGPNIVIGGGFFYPYTDGYPSPYSAYMHPYHGS